MLCRAVWVVEVASVLGEHPSVLEVAVVGEPDDIRDEVPVGYVVVHPEGASVDSAELLPWCEARLAKSKRPQRIELADELPRPSVGTIRKFILHPGSQATST